MVVSDKGNPPRQSHKSYVVMVLGENDNSLPFSKTNLVFTVPENSRFGHVVGSVKPEDPNYDLTDVWYSIVQGNDEGVFDIENHSGNLLVVGDLDADIDLEYNIKVSLNDNMYGMSRQIIRVKIIVSDINDNPPKFLENPLRISVPEDAPVGSPIYAISAKDIEYTKPDTEVGQ